ncbi:MAG: lytic transglycosylase domain-containing protein [Rhodospirillales bacterium]|nr:lytic transglycosylase domain-containing protein [Rhodospirillales bacterium]
MLIAGAAILAGLSFEGAAGGQAWAQSQDTTDQTAFANPRVAPRGLFPVALPQPLSPSEAALTKAIFALQARGRIADAAQRTDTLDTSSPLGAAMLGEILADRYLGRFTRPDADTLRAWLARWADLPDAPALHALLLARLPRGQAAPPPPSPPGLARAGQAAPVPEESEPAGMDLKRNARLDRAVHAAARSGHPYAAARLINGTSDLSPTYAAQLRGEAAQILFTLNRDQEAFDTAAAGAHCAGVARPGARRPCEQAALPFFEAGLAAWRMGEAARARPMFEAAWRASFTTPALKAAAAFWAARAHVRLYDPAGYMPWMRRAAAQPATFYGQIARRSIGLYAGIADRDHETLGLADIAAVAATPAGNLAFALLQIGQPARAEAALRLLGPQVETDPALARAVMLVAARAGLVDLAAQLADIVQAADGLPRDATRFPVPHLLPSGGFRVDPALVYALARAESNFDAHLISPAGASGLMQIMPETARFIVRVSAGAPDASGPGASGPSASGPGALRDAATNLDLGQRYVAYLALHEAVRGNLIRLLASYNAGPAGFARWADSIRDNNDPLLFIEAIPIDETRAFVPRVLAYGWIYAARMGLPALGLDELAAGHWPRYHPLDAGSQVASARLH